MIDPTRLPPPAYSLERADEIYRPAFHRAMDFVCCQGIPGDVLEFGTHNGYTARILAHLMKVYSHPGNLMLFDSFEGFPDAEGIDRDSPEVRAGGWARGFPAGRQDNLIATLHTILGMELSPQQVKLFPGWFKDTMIHLPDQPPSLVHIDCDMFESTLTVLRALRFQQGMIVMFDDWNSGRASNQLGERAAVRELGLERMLEPWFSYGWHGASFICQVE